MRRLVLVVVLAATSPLAARKPTAIVFGLTFRPEVCPTPLPEQTAALNLLGPDADKPNVAFVSQTPSATRLGR